MAWRLAAAVVLALAIAPASTTAIVRHPRCTAVTKAQSARFDVAFRLRCNFQITTVGLRSSRRVLDVQHDTSLRNPDPEDGVRCRRRSRSRIRCEGQAGQDVRVSGAYAVKGDPCEGLRTRIHVLGGEDCDPPGTPCIAIAYTEFIHLKHPRGCG